MSVIDIKQIKLMTSNRQFSVCPKFSTTELRYVAQHPSLSDGEKLLWLMMAQQAVPYRKQNFQISDFKIAELIGEKISAIPKLIQKMEALGFIEINNHDFMSPRYKLSLPDNGLVALMQGPYTNNTDKSSQIARVKTKFHNMNLLLRNILQSKILKRSAHKSYDNTYLGNCNLLATKFDSQLQTPIDPRYIY